LINISQNSDRVILITRENGRQLSEWYEVLLTCYLELFVHRSQPASTSSRDSHYRTSPWKTPRWDWSQNYEGEYPGQHTIYQWSGI